MRSAIASEGKDIGSDICQTAGRAPYYLIFEDKKLVKTIKNPFATGGGGAGIAVAQMLSNEKVEKVISGKFGGKMKDRLKEKKIEFKEVNDRRVEEEL